MTIANKIVNHIESLQRCANSSYELYPSHQCILPNDAIAPLRYSQLNDFAKLVESLASQSKKTLSEVVEVLKVHSDDLKKQFPYIGEAIDVIIKDFA